MAVTKFPKIKQFKPEREVFADKKAILEAILLEHLNILTLTKKSSRSIDQFLENSILHILALHAPYLLTDALCRNLVV